MKANKIEKTIRILTCTSIIIMILHIILPKYIVLNKTPSIREGIYLILPYNNEKDSLNIGDIVIFDMPKDIEKFVKEREYITNDTNTFIKTVGATEGMSIEVREEKLFIDGEIKGEVALTDTLNRELPQINNFIVSKGHFFPLGTHFHSFDGRYYGEIDKRTIRNKAKLLIGF